MVNLQHRRLLGKHAAYASCIVVNAATGLIFPGGHVSGWQPLATSLLLGATLTWLSLIDIRSFRLPDRITVPLAVAGIFFVGAMTPDAIVWRVASAAVGYLSLFSVSWAFLRFRGYPGLGLGDAKLFAAGGAWLGMEGLPSVILLASAAGLFVALVAMLSGAKIGATTKLPFGPFLASAIWIIWLAGPLV